MDCRTAIEILEMAGSDSGDGLDAQRESARDHVDSCPACPQTLSRRRELDRAVGRAIRDVPVPPGLKERLLDATSAAEAVDAAPSKAAPSSTVSAPSTGGAMIRPEQPAGPETRSRHVRYVFGAAACLLIGLVVWFFVGSTPRMYSLQELQQVTALDLRELPDFAGRFEASLPQGWQSSRGLAFRRTAKGWPPEAAAHDVALYEFRFRYHRQAVRGVLLVVPKSVVKGEVPAEFFSGAEGRYVSSTTDRFTTAAWTEGNFVYICSLQDGADALEALQNRMEPVPA